MQRFYRPAMLMTPERPNLSKSNALAIKLFRRAAPLLRGPLKNWHGILPQTVAQAMVNNAMNNVNQHINRYVEMIKVAK